MAGFPGNKGGRTAAALLLLAGMVLVIAIVLAFEHVGGYIPCKLCLEQRVPYYFGMPVAVIAALSAGMGGPHWLTRSALAIAGLLMIWTMGLGIYHAGVEWSLWAGPTDCGAAGNAISTNVNDLLADLTAKRPPSCDSAAGRFLGISFAGWNVVAALVLVVIAFRGAFGRGD